MKFLAAILLLVSFAAIAQNEETLLLTGFESPRETAIWKIPPNDPSTLEFNSDANYIVSGKGSARFKSPKAGDGLLRWPMITLTALPTRNWRCYDELSLDVINPGTETVDLRIQLLTADDGKTGHSWMKIPPGKNHLTWQLPDIVRRENIHGVRLFQDNPPKEYMMYLDNLAIHIRPDLLPVKTKQLLEILSEADQPDWDQAGMRKQFNSLIAEINGLAASRSSAAGKARILGDTEKKLNELKIRRNRQLNELKIKEFNAAFPSGWGYGISSGMEKISRDEYPVQSRFAAKAAVSLARNERESLQVVLRSNKPLNNVRVQVSDLKNTAGAHIIPAGNLKIYTVGYVKPLSPVYPVEPLTWYPDPLIDFLADFTLDAGVWQPVWLDIFADGKTAPGTYAGTISIHSAEQPVLEIPLEVNVWNFALSEQNTLPTVISHPTYSIRNYYAALWGKPEAGTEASRYFDGKIAYDQLSEAGRKLVDIELAAELELLQCRITPTPIYNTRRPVNLQDVRRWHAHGGKSFNLWYINPVNVKAGEPYPAWGAQRAREFLGALVPELSEAGFLKDAFIYCFDEIKEDGFFAAKSILEKVKEINPDIPLVTTALDPTFGKASGLEDVIDVWCPGEKVYWENQERIREVRRNGKKVWYYTCMYRKGMNFLLEATGSAPRLLVGLAQFKFESDGFLYYNTCNWKGKQIVDRGPLTTHKARSYQAYNGDGLLLYPGTQGALPSIRLKNIRDGFEDLEYWFLLKQLKDTNTSLDAADQLELEALLQIKPETVESFERFDATGKLLESERLKAGNLLSKYVTPRPASGP